MVQAMALVAVVLVFAKMNSQGFNILWRYFAWSSQCSADKSRWRSVGLVRCGYAVF